MSYLGEILKGMFDLREAVNATPKGENATLKKWDYHTKIEIWTKWSKQKILVCFYHVLHLNHEKGTPKGWISTPKNVFF